MTGTCTGKRSLHNYGGEICYTIMYV